MANGGISSELAHETADLSSPVEQLRWIFDLCDQDHDGLITVEEFRSLGHHYLGAVSQSIDMLINDIDPDTTGVITFDNFRKGIESYLNARRESASSSRSGSLSRASFDEGFVVGSPTNDNSFVEDVSHSPSGPFLNSSELSYLSLGYNTDIPSSPIRTVEEPTIHEVVSNGIDNDSHHSADDHSESGLNSSSLPDIEIQLSGNSPTLVAKSLLRRSNHSYLHVSGSANSFSSTPEWRIEEDPDELTEKLQELSARLEGLEMDLDSSHSEKLKLRRENGTLRERLDMFQDTLRDLECDKEESVRKVRNESSMNLAKLKKEHNREVEELQYQLQQEQERGNAIEGSVSILKHQLEEKELECQDQLKNNSILQSCIVELKEQLNSAKEQLRLEREKWVVKTEESQQEVVAMTHVIEHLRKELEDNKFTKKRNSTNTSDMRLGEIMLLKKEIKTLKEERDNLSSQLLRQGQLLVAEQPQSLADELKDAPKADVMKALKEQEELNIRLRAYIEGLLVTILNSHPELLEIKLAKK